MSEIEPFTVIRLLSGLPEHDVAAGALAVVLEVHSEPYEAYEVEVVDEAGQTVFAGTVDPAQCIVVHHINSIETPVASGGEDDQSCGGD